jgi:hypothetical protein
MVWRILRVSFNILIKSHGSIIFLHISLQGLIERLWCNTVFDKFSKRLKKVNNFKKINPLV